MTGLKLQSKLFALLVCSFALLATNFVTAQIQIGSDIDGESLYDFSGRTSMPDAFTVAIGATGNSGNGSGSGHVRVFRLVAGAWIQKGTDIDGEAAGDNSGVSVSMPDSNTVAIGATLNNGNGQRSGHVRVFSWNGSTWVQKGLDIDGEVAFLESGNSVSMPDANTLAIGTMKGSAVASNAGQVRVFQFIGGAWVQKGGNIDGEAAQDGSGVSVSMPDANTVGIGALSNDGNGMNAGHVRVYVWNGTGWIQKGSDLDGEAAGDQSGRAISMPDINTVAIGASSNSANGSHSGHVRIYNWNGTAWTQKGADIDGLPGEQFGTSVSMPNANTVAVGAPGNNNNNGNSSGAVRIYGWNGSAWLQRGNDIIGEASNDISGYSVSMPDVNTIGIGAILNGGSAINAGHVRVFDVSPPPIATVSIDNKNSAVLCSGNSILVTATATNSNVFEWRNLDSAVWRSEGNAGISSTQASYQSLAIDAVGTPYVAYMDNGVGSKTTVKKFDGTSWITVGNPGFSAGSATYQSLAIDRLGTPYVAFQDFGSGQKATVMKYNGSAWVNVGAAGFSPGVVFDLSLAIDNSGTPYLAFRDFGNGQRTTVMKYDGSNWITVGNAGFSAGSADYQNIAIDAAGNPIVAYRDAAASNKATVMKFNGSSWGTIGNAGFSTSNSSFNSLAIDASGNPIVAFRDGSVSNKATVMKYDGSAWVVVGSPGISLGDIQYTSVVVDELGIPYVAYADFGDNGRISVKKFDGSSWVSIGNAAVSAGQTQFANLAISILGTPYVAFRDYSDSAKTTVMKLDAPIISSSSTVNINKPGNYQILAYGSTTAAYDEITVTQGNSAMTNTSVIVSSASYTWADNGQTYTTSGTYSDTLTTVSGCDSISTLILNFKPTISIDNGDSVVLCGLDSIYLTTTFTNISANPNSLVWRNLDSADWSVEGNAGFSAGIASYLSLAVDNSGTPYVAYRDEGVGNKTTVQKFDGSNWVNVGSPSFSVGATFDHSIAIDSTGTPYVVYRDLGLAPGSQATVMRFDGNAWVSTGNGGFSTRSTNRTKIAFDDSGMLYLVYEDPFSGGKVTVEKYDGTSWSTVGVRGFSAGQSAYPSIAFDGSTPYVAFQDATNGQRTTVMKFDGSAWVVVGTPGFSQGSSEFQNLVISNSGTPSVAYKDNGLRGVIVVEQFDGNTWNTLPNGGLAATNISANSLAVDNSGTLYLLFSDPSRGNRASLMKFNGSSWEFVGSRGFSSGSSGQINLAFDNSGTPYAGFIDGPNFNKATVMKSVSPILSFGNGISIAKPGTYQVTAISGNLTAFDTIVISSGVNTFASFSVNTCSSYSWQGSTFTTSGTYYAVIPNAAGCDSIMTLNLTFDNIKPTVVTKNTSLYLDSAGVANISIADVNDGSSDNCGTPTLALSKSIFTCTDLGSNTVWLIATDSSGNVDSSSAIVTVIDTVRPTVLTNNISVYLDSTGSVSIVPAYINNSSADACGIASLSISKNIFTCSEIGTNTIRLIATDNNGNIDSATAIVTVIDTVKPKVSTNNISVFLDNSGSVSITPSDVNGTTTDNCGTPTLTLSKNSFTCTEVGANTIWLIATDSNGNVDSTSSIVTVIDTLKPTVVTQNILVYLDNSGSVSIVPADINNNSNDVCGTPTLSLDKTSFTCAEVGANTVYLIATDVNNNIDSAMATATVIDTIKPSVITQNINVYLDATGNVSIVPTDVDNGSTDVCGAPTLSLAVSSFTCAEVGANTVWLKATDVNGNIDSTSATVTVLDTIKPTVITQNINAYLDATGNVSIVPTDVDNGSTDVCGAPTLSLAVSSFTCAEVGANIVTLTATDVNSNAAFATAVVTVLDTIKPTVITQNINAYLDATGNVSIVPTDVDNGSSDICGAPTLTIDVNSFTCAEVGANTVTLTATDVNNNVASATVTVTVIDTIKPAVITQNINAYLDATGNVSIVPTDVDNGSSDVCGAPTLSLDVSSFSCAEVGANTVTLTATDVNNNVASATAVITVLDTIKPLISNCVAPINQAIDAGNCSAVVSWTLPTTADNCMIDSLVSSHNSGDVFALGTTTVTYIAYDPSMNSDTCSFTVTITDDEDPVISGIPADITVNNDLGNCSAVVTWTAPSAADNCTLDSLVSSSNSGDAFPVGTTTITYTAYDAAMNTSVVSFTVTVNDTELPTIVCPNDIAQCDSIVYWSSPVGNDNCTVASTVRFDAEPFSSGDEFPIGTTTLSYQVTDIHNNQTTCDFDVTVFTPPVAHAGPNLATRDIVPIPIQAKATNAQSVLWSPFESLNDETVIAPLANPQLTTVYSMTVTSPDGCTDTDTMTITVDVVENLVATTLFSPNGDGMNDTWVINKPALISGCRVIIVNRNGSEVYSTSNYNNDWDATINGAELPEGTYYYVIDCPDGREFNGPITVIREKR
ncbi:MAG: HYR domain-containing protein [Bacteroidetes bacterium]|nr:HYR domain-containing protein [Bacteroidota bacterium]